MTVKQQAFCDNYIANGFTNAAKAAIDAGYSKKTATSIGSENLQKPDLRNYIASMVKKYLTSRDRRAVKLLNMLEHAANFDIRNIVEWAQETDAKSGLKVNNISLKPSDKINPLDAMMISGISQMRDGSIRLKLVQKEKAWEMLAAFTRLINDNPDQTEEKELDDNARKERISYLTEKLKK